MSTTPKQNTNAQPDAAPSLSVSFSRTTHSKVEKPGSLQESMNSFSGTFSSAGALNYFQSLDQNDTRPLQISFIKQYPNGHRDERSYNFTNMNTARRFLQAVLNATQSHHSAVALEAVLGGFADHRNDLNQPNNNNSAASPASSAASPSPAPAAKKSGIAEFFKRIFSAIEAAFVKLVKLCLSSSKAKPAAPSTTATASASLSASAHSNPLLEAHAARIKADNEKINSAMEAHAARVKADNEKINASIKSHQATVKSQNNVLKSMFDAHAKKVKQGNEKVKEGMKGHQSLVSSQNAQIDSMVQDQQTRLTNR